MLSALRRAVQAPLLGAGFANTVAGYATATKGKVLCVLYSAAEAAKEQPLLYGCVENALGLKDFLKEQGYEFVVTSDKEGPGCEMEKHLADADVLITTPFHPGYMTPERFALAPKLKLCLTAGIGSDHINLDEAVKRGVTVAEITGCNVTSVAEHSVMMHLMLVRNFMTAHHQVINGEWNVAQIAKRAWDIEGKQTGVLGAGRIGQRIMARLKPFNVGKVLYYDLIKLKPEVEEELNVTWVDMDTLFQKSKVMHVITPLTAGTRGMINTERINTMPDGAYIVNCARGAICDRDSIVEALKSGKLAGYAGDVWFPQPAPKDHPWRTMPFHAMTPHYSGTTLDPQRRYAEGVKDILTRFFRGQPLPPQDVIVQGGKLAAQYDPTAKQEERNVDFKKEESEFAFRFKNT